MTRILAKQEKRCPPPNPHGGVRPFHQTSTCLTQSNLGSDVVQFWSLVQRMSGASEPSNSTEWNVGPIWSSSRNPAPFGGFRRIEPAALRVGRSSPTTPTSARPLMYAFLKMTEHPHKGAIANLHRACSGQPNPTQGYFTRKKTQPPRNLLQAFAY